MSYDWDDKASWLHSMELFGKELMPALNKAVGRGDGLIVAPVIGALHTSGEAAPSGRAGRCNHRQPARGKTTMSISPATEVVAAPEGRSHPGRSAT